MTWYRIFLIVTGCALAGMVMGGLFGFGAGVMAPDLFRSLVPWDEVEPRGAATFLGSVAGVLLGGGLGCFGIAVQVLMDMRRPTNQ